MPKSTKFTKSYSEKILIDNVSNPKDRMSSKVNKLDFEWYFHARKISAPGNWLITFWANPTIIQPLRKPLQAKATLTLAFPTKELIVNGEYVALNYEKAATIVSMQNIIAWNSVTVRCNWTVSSICQPNFVFSTPNLALISDVILIAEDREFHVCKPMLANASTYFKTMFYEKFSESKESRIKLEDVDADDFQELLEVIYHKTNVTSNNASELLELVTYFDMEDIKNKCEQVLINCPITIVTSKEKLALADEYTLPNLMKHCLDNLKSVNEIKEVTPRDVQELKSSTITQLLQKVIDI